MLIVMRVEFLAQRLTTSLLFIEASWAFHAWTLVEFTLKGQPFQLTAFVEVGARNVDHLFVPFADMTSGTETYAAGRFMDLNRNGTGIYEVDFNRAYIPYCYYSPTYECPYPPPENRLQTPIRAGERMKK